ncbi:hypothetical protein GCM10010176_063120 [Nonomuraea spiralis]|nr:hypothetical protein GCM10010176_063120 [Nonomuraea spiralis]
MRGGLCAEAAHPAPWLTNRRSRGRAVPDEVRRGATNSPERLLDGPPQETVQVVRQQPRAEARTEETGSAAQDFVADGHDACAQAADRVEGGP